MIGKVKDLIQKQNPELVEKEGNIEEVMVYYCPDDFYSNTINECYSCSDQECCKRCWEQEVSEEDYMNK